MYMIFWTAIGCVVNALVSWAIGHYFDSMTVSWIISILFPILMVLMALDEI